MMGSSLKDRLDRLPQTRRTRIKADAARLHAEYLTMQELRKARTLTQVELAEVLGVRQATVAQMEKRSDLLLSTLRGYVEAMGGTLRLTIEFPDRDPVVLGGIGETETKTAPQS